MQILPILTVLRLVGFFLGRIVKIFERDNVLCIALKVSVFVEKIFGPVYIGALFQTYCFGSIHKRCPMF